MDQLAVSVFLRTFKIDYPACVRRSCNKATVRKAPEQQVILCRGKAVISIKSHLVRKFCKYKDTDGFPVLLWKYAVTLLKTDSIAELLSGKQQPPLFFNNIQGNRALFFGAVSDKGRWFLGKGKTSFHEKRSRNVGSGIFSLPLSAAALCKGGNPFQEKRSIL